MSMRNVNFVLILLASLVAFAQDTALPKQNISRPSDCPSSDHRCGDDDNSCLTEEKFLECRNFASTMTGLTGALADSDPEIRSAAAGVLASRATSLERDEVISALVNALKDEKQVRFAMVLALLQMGTPEGFSAMRKRCDDGSLLVVERISAGLALAQAGDNYCLNTVLAILKSDSREGRSYALSSLKQYKNASPEQAQAVFNLLTSSLMATQSLSNKSETQADYFTELQVRIAASETLVALGNMDAIPYFERALASEQDRRMTSVLRADLQRLLKKKP